MIDKKKAVFIIHTSFVSVDCMRDLFSEMVPDATVHNIIDDSLLAEVLRNGGVTASVRRRMFDYYVGAEDAGADLIFNQCSSVGEVADAAADLVRIPVVRVDRRMAERACQLGEKIGIIATLPTTMGPTSRLVRRVAAEVNKDIEIKEHICEGAFQLLMSGDRAGHNRMVIEGIKELAGSTDVVVCAQGSMVALLADLESENIQTPVLTSPRMGVEHAAEAIANL